MRDAMQAGDPALAKRYAALVIAKRNLRASTIANVVKMDSMVREAAPMGRVCFTSCLRNLTPFPTHCTAPPHPHAPPAQHAAHGEPEQGPTGGHAQQQ